MNCYRVLEVAVLFVVLFLNPLQASLIELQSEIVEDGSATHNYTLYRFEDGTDTLGNARSACEALGSELASIRNNQTQEALRRMKHDITYGHGNHHAWLSGRRSDDITWRNIRGKKMDIDPEQNQAPTPGPRLCISVTVTKDQPIRWLSSPCAAMHRTLCQTHHMADSCPLGFFAAAGGCYRFLPPDRFTWIRARDACQSLKTEADLAYSNFNDPELLKTIASVIPGATSSISSWVGVVSKPWLWAPGDRLPDVSASTMVTYQYWGGGQGASRNDERCMVMDLKVDSRWGDVKCDASAAYLVCDKHNMPISNAPHPTTHSDITESDVSKTQPEREATQSVGATASPTFDEANILTTEQIIGVAVAGGVVLLLIILVPVIVCCRRRRRVVKQEAAIEGDPMYYNDAAVTRKKVPKADKAKAKRKKDEVTDNSYANHIETQRDSTEDGHVTRDVDDNVDDDDLQPYATAGTLQRDVSPPASKHSDVTSARKHVAQNGKKAAAVAMDATHVVGPVGDIYTLPIKSSTRDSGELNVLENDLYREDFN